MEKLNLQGHETGARSFREIYFSMDNTPPKKAFIQKIATITKRSESAVRCSSRLIMWKGSQDFVSWLCIISLCRKRTWHSCQ